MPYEPIGYGDILLRPASLLPLRTRLVMLTLVVVVIVLIIARNAGSMERETRGAFRQRFGQTPELLIGPMYRRGVACGAYAFHSGPRGGFVYVSNMSAEDPRQRGLHLSQDAAYAGVAGMLCR